MKHILQHGDDDCGIASLAMYFDQPYEVINELIRKPYVDAGVIFPGTMNAHFEMACRTLGAGKPLCELVTDANRETYRELIRGTQAVLIVPAKGYHPDINESHAVAWTGRQVFDPSPGGYGKAGIKVLRIFKEVWWTV